MSTENTVQTTVTASYVVNASNGKVKAIVTNKTTKKEENKPPKSVSGFAKNTRYSIYNNGGGYTGL